jgi:hypothetical protein
MTGERRFTVEEANGSLPALRDRLARVRASRQVIVRGSERIRRSADMNGGGDVGKEYLDALDTLRREVEAIIAEGIVLRDAESGLVDFPSERGGREVFLCWRLGEDRVAFWHTPESGFTGRRPL